MRIKFISLLLVVIFITGCASYTFEQKAKDGGYIVRRYGLIVPEYTIGKNNKAPEDLNLARERFKRRKAKVNYYYIKMGYIDNPYVEYIKAFFKSFTVPFRLPFVIAGHMKYERNASYRERIDRIEEEKEKKEDERNARIMEQLQEFINQDLENEARQSKTID